MIHSFILIIISFDANDIFLHYLHHSYIKCIYIGRCLHNLTLCTSTIRNSFIQLEELISPRAKGAGKLSVIICTTKQWENLCPYFTRDGKHCNGRCVCRSTVTRKCKRKIYISKKAFLMVGLVRRPVKLAAHHQSSIREPAKINI